MPELPEVETTVRGLRPFLEAHTLKSVETRRGDLRRPFPVDLRQRLTGARVTGLNRRAKYGLIDTDRGDTLVFHLGMSGKWRIDPAELGKHDHFLLQTEAGHTLALNDARRFGSVDLVETDKLWDWPAFKALGPEPLGSDLTARYFRDAFARRTMAVKILLLDQRIVAGVGNIYACEALNVARISPFSAAGSLSMLRLKRLVEAIPEVLNAAIDAGGSTLRDYAQPNGDLGYFASRFRVYGREGKPCPCGGTVRRDVQAARSTFWCPRCQR
jgi:formamidopyrimidine-DNA glycosylase